MKTHRLSRNMQLLGNITVLLSTVNAGENIVLTRVQLHDYRGALCRRSRAMDNRSRMPDPRHMASTTSSPARVLVRFAMAPFRMAR